MTIPNDKFLIVIGAMKSGTSSFFDYLSQHPRICASVPKETEYFSEHQHHKRTADRYDSFWPDFDASQHDWALEASTGYTKWPRETNVPQRMYASGIQPRLLYVVRNPFDRIESHVNYIRLVSSQKISLDDKYPVDVSRYFHQLSPYIELYGRENIKLIDFDELRRAPEEVCNDVFSWLGLSRFTVDGSKISNETDRQAVSRVKRFLTGNRVLRRIARAAPEKFKSGAEAALVRVTPYSRKKVTLSEERRRTIHDELLDDMLQLRDQFGIDVSKWGFN